MANAGTPPSMLACSVASAEDSCMRAQGEFVSGEQAAIPCNIHGPTLAHHPSPYKQRIRGSPTQLVCNLEQLRSRPRLFFFSFPGTGAISHLTLCTNNKNPARCHGAMQATMPAKSTG